MGAVKIPLVNWQLPTTMADENMEIEQETPAPVEVIDAEPLDTVSALKQVLKKALCADGLARGIRECAKMLDKRAVHLCVLADNCNEPAYKKLTEALCTEHSISLMKVDDNSLLGEWAGLCKMDAEGNARKVVSCSCVCVTDYGEQSEALDFLLKDLKN